MTPERFERIETLFHAARERASDDRARFLAAACGSDDALRDEVESLLQQRDGDLLDRGIADAAARLVAPAAPGQREGQAIGRYILGPLLGAGGMGEVYRAHDSKLGRDIAVKILPATLDAYPERLGRFEREARVLAALNHPHIAAIYGFEEGDQLRGLILELVDGVTLAERLATGSLPLRDALSIASQIADALKAAHDKGIVHRDLKPGNVKITNAGTVKVLDFGLAKAAVNTASDTDSDTIAPVTATQEGMVLGTAPYMSPEQARGSAVDHRTDIWAFGCVLYELLTGQRAFNGTSTVDVLAAVINREPDLTQLPPRTPRTVRALLGACLQKDPARRVGDMGEVKAALTAAQAARPTATTVAAAALMGAAIIAVAIWMGTLLPRSSSSPSGIVRSADALVPPDVSAFASLRPARLTTSSGFEGFLAFSHDGKNVVYSSDRSGSMEIYVEGLGIGSAALQLTDNGRQNVQPVWSPDDQLIAYHEMAGDGIWIVPSRGGTPRRLSNFGSNAAWSPDQRHIAFQSWPVVDLNSTGAANTPSTIWTVETGEHRDPVRLSTSGAPSGSHVRPLWLPDSRGVIFAAVLGSRSGNTALWHADLADPRPTLMASSPKLTHDFVLAANGRSVYFKAGDAPGVWWLALSPDGTTVEPQPTGLPLAGTLSHHLTMSPDGRRLGWTAFEQTGNVWAVDLNDRHQTQDAVPLTEGVGVRYGLPAPASDGRLVMVGSRPGSNSSLFLLGAGSPLRQVTTDRSSHGAPRWMPGDQHIAYISDHGQGPGFWAIEPDTGRERLLLSFSALPRAPGATEATLSGASLSGAMSRDFTRIAVAFTRANVPNIWVAPLTASGPTGQLMQRTFEKESGTFPSWSPDGRWIAYQCLQGSDTHLCVTGAEGGERVQLTNEPGQSWTGGWSPDSETILIAARRNAVWNVAAVSRSTGTMRTLTRFTAPRIYVRYPKWDRAGKRVVFEHSETLGRIWSVELPVVR